LEAKEGAGKVLGFSGTVCLKGFASAITRTTLWSVAKLQVQTSLQLTYSLKGLLNINKAVGAGVQCCYGGNPMEVQPKRTFIPDEKRLKAKGSEVSIDHLTLLFCGNSKYNRPLIYKLTALKIIGKSSPTVC